MSREDKVARLRVGRRTGAIFSEVETVSGRENATEQALERDEKTGSRLSGAIEVTQVAQVIYDPALHIRNRLRSRFRIDSIRNHRDLAPPLFQRRIDEHIGDRHAPGRARSMGRRTAIRMVSLGEIASEPAQVRRSDRAHQPEFFRDHLVLGFLRLRRRARRGERSVLPRLESDGRLGIGSRLSARLGIGADPAPDESGQHENGKCPSEANSPACGHIRDRLRRRHRFCVHLRGLENRRLSSLRMFDRRQNLGEGGGFCGSRGHHDGTGVATDRGKPSHMPLNLY
jgi:hypothetical protein